MTKDEIQTILDAFMEYLYGVSVWTTNRFDASDLTNEILTFRQPCELPNLCEDNEVMRPAINEYFEERDSRRNEIATNPLMTI